MRPQMKRRSLPPSLCLTTTLTSAHIVSGVKSRAGPGSLLQLFMQNKWNILYADGMCYCLAMHGSLLNLQLAPLSVIEDERKAVVLGYT